MSEEKKDKKAPVEPLLGEASYVLKVKVSLEDENGNSFSAIDSSASLPFLFAEEHILLTEPRVRKQLNSLIEPFNLSTATKVNKIIEKVKESMSEKEDNTETTDDDLPEAID